MGEFHYSYNKLYVLWQKGVYSEDSIVGYFLDKNVLERYIDDLHNDYRTKFNTYWVEEENIIDK